LFEFKSNTAANDVIDIRHTHCSDKFLIALSSTIGLSLDLFKEQIIGHVPDIYSVHADE